MSIIKEENLAKVVPVIETYVNGLSWYRIYADGWCEQGGIYNQGIGADTYPRIMLLYPFKDTNYTCFNNFIQTAVTGSWGSGAASIRNINKTTTYFDLVADGPTNIVGCYWFACGFTNIGE